MIFKVLLNKQVPSFYKISRIVPDLQRMGSIKILYGLNITEANTYECQNLTLAITVKETNFI